MQKIKIYEKHIKYYETEIDWKLIRSHNIEILLNSIKETVWDSIITLIESISLEDYDKIRKSGVLFQRYPNAIWIYEKDKHLFE